MSFTDFTASVTNASAALQELAKQADASAAPLTGMAKLIQEISGMSAYGGGGTISDLLDRLSVAILKQKEYQSGRATGSQWENQGTLQIQIDAMVLAIQKASGKNFDPAAFAKWLEHPESGGAPAGAPGAPTSGGSGLATALAGVMGPAFWAPVQKASADQQALWDQREKDAADAAKKASGDLMHSTDILRTTSDDLGAQIKFLMWTMNQGVMGINKAADDAAKKIDAAAKVAGNIGGMGSMGLLP